MNIPYKVKHAHNFNALLVDDAGSLNLMNNDHLCLRNSSFAGTGVEPGDEVTEWAI